VVPTSGRPSCSATGPSGRRRSSRCGGSGGGAGAGRRTLGADKGYDTPDFIAGVRALGFTPHVSPNRHRWRSTVDARTTRHPGYLVSQRKRKLVEAGFGWHKSVGLLRKLHHGGREKVAWIFAFTRAAYNLVRLRSLLAAAAT